MRLVWGVALFALTACNAILGIGDIRVAGDDAGNPDTPPSDVQGTAIDVFYTSPTTTEMVPEDLSTFVLQAYIPDGSAAGFRVVDVTGHKDGTFTIPSVPAGRYYLLVLAPGAPIARFFETTSHTLDLGFKLLGRHIGPRATQPTVLTLHLTGFSPIQTGDRFFLDSYATNADTSFSSAAGATSFDQSVDWKDLGAPLLDPTKGDDLYVVHQRRTTDSTTGELRQTIVDAFSTTALSLVDGQPASVTAAFQVPAKSTTVSYSLDPASYLQDLDFPSHQPISVVLRIRASFYGGASQGAPLLVALQTFSTSTAMFSNSATYLDPFPADWPRTVLAFPNILWNYAARGTQRTGSLISAPIARKLVSPGFVEVSAPFGAPHAIKVGGVDTSRAAAVPFDGMHPVTVEWAPVTGVRHYSVLVTHVVDNGTGADVIDITTLDTAATTLSMPASLFKLGDSYVLTVTAMVDPTTDYAGGTLRLEGYPDGMREAATARLLFAASCGNGTVDAAYEECDASGAATATCNPDCTKPICGDGFANAAAGEVCDDAGESVACNKDCTPASCGDGKINATRGEQCDLGAQNGQPGACCSATCTLVPPATKCP